MLSLDVGGQERLILNLSRELVARGHDVKVISLTRGGSLRPEFEGIEVLDVPRERAEGFDIGLVGRLTRALRRARPDAVHTHNAAPLIYAAPAARLGRVSRLIHTKHGANTYTRSSLALARFATRLLSAFVAVSKETATVAEESERVTPRLLRVIPNGIPLSQFRRDLEKRARVRDQLKIPDGAVVVGTVGRLVEEKDHPLLVRALSPHLGPNLRLLIVGEGPQRKNTEAAIKPELAEFVTLTGARHDVPSLLSAFDLFAMSSRTEGLPLVVPEAMACGLPVVATAVGGLPGIVPPEVGVLVPHGDADALGRALAELAADASRRARLGEAAERYANERFSIDRMTGEYEELYGGRNLRG